jgi:hypothetical protein
MRQSPQLLRIVCTDSAQLHTRLGSTGKPVMQTKEYVIMKKTTLSVALLAALFAAGASAQPMPPPPGAPGVPPAEELATVPDLTAAQQIELRKILIQRRDAQEAAGAKLRAEFDALRAKERSEHERIDEQSSEQLRKLLGDDGYRKFAAWDLAHRGPPGPGVGPHPPMPPHDGRRGGPDKADSAPPPPGAGPGRDAPGDASDE